MAEAEKAIPKVIGFLSGKGGVGKTLFSSMFTRFLTERGFKVLHVDADIDAPNSREGLERFFKLEKISQTEIYKFVPEFNDNCKSCGKCVYACQFGALVKPRGEKPVLLPTLCHSCKLCFRVCPFGAVEDKKVLSGRLTRYALERSGRRVGELAEFSIIEGEHILEFVKHEFEDFVKKVKSGKLLDDKFKDLDFVIIDGPAGVSELTEAVAELSDLLVLVYEATVFGVRNLYDLLADISKALPKPAVFIENKSLNAFKKDTKGMLQAFVEFREDIFQKLAFSRRDIWNEILSDFEPVFKLYEEILQYLEQEFLGMTFTTLQAFETVKRVVNEPSFKAKFRNSVADVVNHVENLIAETTPNLKEKLEELARCESVAVAAGKGGAGKSLVSLWLASVRKAILVDADVATPSVVLMGTKEQKTEFLRKIVHSFKVSVDEKHCRSFNGQSCNVCGEVCEFAAIKEGRVLAGCEGCGACVEFCPEKCISLIPEGEAEIAKYIDTLGNIREVIAASVKKASGLGKVVDTLVNEALVESRRVEGAVVIDATAGTSCPVISAIKASSAVVVVVEASEVGFKDAARLIASLDVLFDKKNVWVLFNKLSKKEVDNSIREKFENFLHRYFEKLGKNTVPTIHYLGVIPISEDLVHYSGKVTLAF